MRWLLFALIAVAAVGYARWIYRAVDLPVADARWLWPFRAAALVLVLVLLFDPMVPGTGSAGGRDRWVLLDASLSMGAGNGPSMPWSEAARRAEALRGEGWRVMRFGTGVEAVDPTEAAGPDQPATRLAPALTAAAEGGAREVVVLSDLRLEDEVAVRAALETLPLEISFEQYGAELPNAGVLSLEVDDRRDGAAAGVAHVEVHGGVPGDTLVLEVSEEGRSLVRVPVPAPGPGLRTRLDVPLPRASETGLVRFEAVLSMPGDAFAADDTIAAYGRVEMVDEGGVVLLSFTPDWEPRHLLPALERTTGLPARGYLRAGADRWVPIGRALDRGGPVDSATVRRAAESAALLVLHGLQGDTDAWTRGMAARSPRLIAFARDARAAAILGVPAAGPRAGEWFVSEDLPASPVAGELGGAFDGRLPPLGSLLIPQGEEGLLRPLETRLRGTGPAQAPLHLRSGEGRRAVLVWASGFWRWAAREDGRRAYETLWSSLAGWLLREPSSGGIEVRPARTVFARGEPVDWRVPPDRTGYRVRVVEADTVVLDSALVTSGSVSTGSLTPGRYRYMVVDAAGDSVSGGGFEVSRHSPDMVPAPSDPSGLTAIGASAAPGVGGGRPLRTLPWPYLIIIGLLCAEWIGRRRSGLR